MNRRRHSYLPILPPAKSLKQRVSIALAWTFSYITWVTPLQIGYMISDRIGDLLYWRSRRYRLSVIDNLRHVHRGSLGEMQLRRQARRVFRTSARNFWDLCRVPHLNRNEFLASIRLPENDWALLDRIQDERRGGIIVTGHIGAFDVVGQSLFIKGYHPYVLTSPTVGEFVYAGVNYLRLSHGAPLEDISPAAIRRMMRVLRNGGFVGFVADRDFTDSGELVEFFGVETVLPTGPIKLARATGAPVIPVFAMRGEQDGREHRYAFHIVDPFYVERTADSGRDIEAGMRQLIEVFEEHLLRAPEQWVMFQRVWPDDLSRHPRASRRLPRARRAPTAVKHLPDRPDELQCAATEYRGAEPE